MICFKYSGTFIGLLTAVFDAYNTKKFPDELLGPNDNAPLLCTEIIEIEDSEEKFQRVWQGLIKRLSPLGRENFLLAWLAKDECGAALFFNYVKEIFSGLNDGDLSHPLVKDIMLAAKKVRHERQYILQFARFQKTADGIYFAALEPRYDVLPSVFKFFQKRFGAQKWILYDTIRDYGFYYNLTETIEIQLPGLSEEIKNGRLAPETLAEDEALYQDLWKNYFKSIAIKERLNPKLQKSFMPKRFWHLLPELD